MQKREIKFTLFIVYLLVFIIILSSFSIAADSTKVKIVDKGLFNVCGIKAGCVSLAIPQNGLDKVNTQIKEGKFNQDVSTDPNFVKSLIQTPGLEATTQFEIAPNKHGVYGYFTGDLQTVLLPPEKRDLSLIYQAFAGSAASNAESPIPKELLPEASKVYDFFSKGFEPGFFGTGSPMGAGSIMRFEVNEDGTKRISLYPDEKSLADGKPYSSYDFSDQKYDKIFDSVASLYLDPKGVAGGQVAALVRGAQKNNILATYNPQEKQKETQLAINPPAQEENKQLTSPPEPLPAVVNPPQPTSQKKTPTPEEILKAKQEALDEVANKKSSNGESNGASNSKVAGTGNVIFGYGR